MTLYVGITGFMNRAEVDACLSALPKNMTLMCGVLVSQKTLRGERNKWHRRYPRIEDIAGIFPVARLAEGLRAEQVAGATQREQHARAMALRTMRAVAALAGVKLPSAADLAGVHVPAKPPHRAIDALPFDLGDRKP